MASWWRGRSEWLLAHIVEEQLEGAAPLDEQVEEEYNTEEAVDENLAFIDVV